MAELLSERDDGAIWDAATIRVRREAEAWDRRLDAYRGELTPKEASIRIVEIGPDRVLGFLDKIQFPPERQILTVADKEGRWSKSKAEIAIASRYPRSPERALFCIDNIERRDRCKARALFWELVRVRRDVEMCADGFGFGLGWLFFTFWKTFAALAERASPSSAAIDFKKTSLVYRSLTFTVLTLEPAGPHLSAFRSFITNKALRPGISNG
jgi:hypothetical protein